MVKITKDASLKIRDDLLQATGQMIRAQGLAVASVAAIAAQAGLTHGAIYRHFPSKDGLAAAAIGRDFDRVVDGLSGIAQRKGKLAEYLTAYLAEDHRDYFFWGCPVAPLAGEMGRNSQTVQAAFCDGLDRNLAAIADLSGIADQTEAVAFAITVLAMLSGAMAMARATKGCNPARSKQILEVTLASLLNDPRLNTL
jgi:TetR/AcrR family transcriptional regulator, transcriptional repressor for nem operon